MGRKGKQQSIIIPNAVRAVREAPLREVKSVGPIATWQRKRGSYYLGCARAVLELSCGHSATREVLNKPDLSVAASELRTAVGLKYPCVVCLSERVHQW